MDAVDFWIDFGMKVITACQKVGIARATYYDHKKKRTATQKETPGPSQRGGSPTSSQAAISSTHLSQSNSTQLAGDVVPNH